MDESCWPENYGKVMLRMTCFYIVLKKMYSLDEEKIECALGNMDI